MISQFFTIIMANVSFILLATSILLGAITGLAARNKEVMVTAMIRYMMLLAVGATSLWFFLNLILFGSHVAVESGWPASPFQAELAMAILGLGFAGFVGFKQKFDFWIAVDIIWTTFLWGAALVHLYQMIVHGNFAPGNVGMVLYTDILSPFLLNFLLYYYWRYYRD